MALLPLVCTASRAGDVYKSVDAEGHVVYSDHADPAAQSSVMHLEDAPAAGPPGVVHFCWTNCFTLELDGGLYRRADGSDETWTVERFTPTSFLLHRHDAPAAWNGFSADVVYEGKISGDRLVNVTVSGRPVDAQAAWGAALDTLPGSNAERDQHNSSPPPIDELRTAEVPPPLQDDTQPPCPDDGYLWTPAYWAWGSAGYYWVPGAWVRPPRAGILWTPGYWSFGGALYIFHPGYWAPHVGYYGGVNYGFGYAGFGFTGGRWVGNSFAYNRAVSNLNPGTVHRTYIEAPVGNPVVSRVSYNGGPGGITALPTAQERAAAAEPHIPATAQQRQIARQAAGTPELVVHTEFGRPSMVSPQKPMVSNAQAVMHNSVARNVAPAAARRVAQPTARPAAAERAAAGEAQDPTPPRPKDAAARPATPKSRMTASGAQHPTH